MKIALVTLVAVCAMGVQDIAGDMICDRGTSKSSITIESGDVVKYKTQKGKYYHGPINCIVNFQLGVTCRKIIFACSESNIPNPDPRTCIPGDRFILSSGHTHKVFCDRRKPHLSSYETIKTQFLVKRGGRGKGAVCTARCSRRAYLSDIAKAYFPGEGNVNCSPLYGNPSANNGHPFTQAGYASSGLISHLAWQNNPNKNWGEHGGLTDLNVTYGPITAVPQGTSGNFPTTHCDFQGNEKITAVQISRDKKTKFVSYLIFNTNLGSVCQLPPRQPNPTYDQTYFYSPPGCHLSYIRGRAGHVLNALSFCFECP